MLMDSILVKATLQVESLNHLNLILKQFLKKNATKPKKVDYTKDYAPREASKNSKLNNDEMTGRKKTGSSGSHRHRQISKKRNSK